MQHYCQDVGWLWWEWLTPDNSGRSWAAASLLLRPPRQGWLLLCFSVLLCIAMPPAHGLPPLLILTLEQLEPACC